MRNEIIRLLFLFMFNSICIAQNSLESTFYKIDIPDKTTVKTFNSTAEELAHIESYQFLQNEKPKYIIYLMSNKITGEVKDVNTDNYKDFCGDIGDIEVSDVKDDGRMVKLLFKYANKETIKGVLFIKLNNNILDRFLFLLPNDKAYELFNKEINDIVKNITDKKSEW